MHRCSSCKRQIRPREENADFPFCSPRCRAVDLSRWFGGEYRIASRERPPAEPPLPSDDERH